MERTYVVPLRKGWLKAPRYKRAKKAVYTLREFLVRHMKSEDIRIGVSINMEIWKHGIRTPPPRIKVTVRKDDKGVVRAELFGVPFEENVEVPKVKKAKKSEPKTVEAKKVEPAESSEKAEAKSAKKRATKKKVAEA